MNLHCSGKKLKYEGGSPIQTLTLQIVPCKLSECNYHAQQTWKALTQKSNAVWGITATFDQSRVSNSNVHNLFRSSNLSTTRKSRNSICTCQLTRVDKYSLLVPTHKKTNLIFADSISCKLKRILLDHTKKLNSLLETFKWKPHNSQNTQANSTLTNSKFNIAPINYQLMNNVMRIFSNV